MTETDERLRSRLSAIDPMHPTTTTEPLAPLRTQQILESAMATIEEKGTVTVPSARARKPFRIAVMASAATVIVAVGVALALLLPGGASQPSGQSVLSLSAGSGTSTSSCIPFDVAFLRDMPVAFAGTVTQITPELVTLDVERWYTGGDADVVSISLPSAQSSAALDGVDFRQGSHYLVAATGGIVNGCGFSGQATAELQAAYAEAFPG